EIANHGAQLRLGFRPGLDALVKELQNPDPTVRAYARATLTEVAADYEKTTSTTGPLLPPNFETKYLLPTIRSDQGPFAPTRVAEAFQRLKAKTSWDVPMFDIPAAEKWCAEHKPKCDE